MDAGAGARRDEDRRRAPRHVQDRKAQDAGKVPRIRPRSRIFVNHPG